MLEMLTIGDDMIDFESSAAHKQRSMLEMINFPKTGVDFQLALQNCHSPYYEIVMDAVSKELDIKAITEEIIERFLYRQYVMTQHEREALLRTLEEKDLAEKEAYTKAIMAQQFESEREDMRENEADARALEISNESIDGAISRVIHAIDVIDHHMAAAYQKLQTIQQAQNDHLRAVILDPTLELKDGYGNPMSIARRKELLDQREQIIASRDEVQIQKQVQAAYHQAQTTEEKMVKPDAVFVNAVANVVTELQQINAACKDADEFNPSLFLKKLKELKPIFNLIQRERNADETLPMMASLVDAAKERANLDAQLIGLKHKQSQVPTPASKKRLDDDENERISFARP